MSKANYGNIRKVLYEPMTQDTVNEGFSIRVATGLLAITIEDYPP